MGDPSTYLNIIEHAVYGIVLLFIGWLVGNWVAKYVKKRGRKSEKYDETLMRVFAQAVKVFILGFVIIVVLAMWGIQTASLIAVIGGLAIGIGMAWQGVIKDFAAGIMLLTMRPFEVGQLIKFGSTTGEVEEIGIVITKMHTLDNLDLTVPNSEIWGNVITNVSANDTRRVDMVFGFGYEDDMDHAMAVAQEMLRADERVLADPEPLIAISELGSSAVSMQVRPWVNAEDYWPFKNDFTKRMKEKFDEEGLNMPYPQHDVHFFQEN